MEKLTAKTHFTIAFALSMTMAGAMLEAHAAPPTCWKAKIDLKNAMDQLKVVTGGVTCSTGSPLEQMTCLHQMISKYKPYYDAVSKAQKSVNKLCKVR